MPNDTGRDRHQADRMAAQTPFSASEQMIAKIIGSEPALEDLHRNTRTLFARDRNMDRSGMFHDRPRYSYAEKRDG
jgi:hypothetical protein